MRVAEKNKRKKLFNDGLMNKLTEKLIFDKLFLKNNRTSAAIHLLFNIQIETSYFNTEC